jgi:hypothetical protein
MIEIVKLKTKNRPQRLYVEVCIIFFAIVFINQPFGHFLALLCYSELHRKSDMESDTVAKQAISGSWMDRTQKPGKYWDGRYGGLGVRVWEDGHNKTWIFQKSGGTRRALGRWPAVSVNEARKIAADHNLAPGRRNGRETIAHVHDVWAQDLIARGKSPLTVKSRAATQARCVLFEA